MTGFAGDPLVLCEDIDECHDRTDGCSDNAYCVNTDGTYECECYEGVDFPVTKSPPIFHFWILYPGIGFDIHGSTV